MVATTTPEHTRATPTSTRPRWLVAGLGLTALAAADVVAGHGDWWVLAVFAVMPDLSFLAAIGATDDIGQQLPRHAVPVYNTLHRLVGPALVVAGTAGGLLPRGALVAGLGWAADIAIDRAAGYGLRDRDGRQRG